MPRYIGVDAVGDPGLLYRVWIIYLKICGLFNTLSAGCSHPQVGGVRLVGYRVLIVRCCPLLPE
jgi:hypothetical protein